MALAMSTGNRTGSDRDFRRFEALFAAELDELAGYADERDVDLEDVAEAYFVIVNGETPMARHEALQNELGRDWRDAWEIASVLVDFGEVHLSKQNGWWWVVASQFLADRCDKRSIGLKQYIEMQPDLAPFQNDVTRWYQVRHMHGNLQTRTMREIKVEHGERLAEKYYPEKPLDTDEFHEHIISRYIKTAQDVIVEALDLSY